MTTQQHNKKKRLARKMMSKAEIKAKTPIFQSAAWEARKEAKKRKVAKTIARQKEASRLRKERLAKEAQK